MNLRTLLMGASLTMALCSCEPQAGSQQNIETGATMSDSSAVISTILARRSIRKYLDKPVEREKLELMVKCGINAPSGLNKQPWAVRVVDNPDYINGVSEIFKKTNPDAAAYPDFKNIFNNAAAVIFIASPKDGTGQLDCGLLGENMILAAHSMGLGTCCLGGPLEFMRGNEEASKYIDRLDFPEDYMLLYAIGVGYPDEQPEARPREENKARFVE